jgi:hypothetical protein
MIEKRTNPHCSAKALKIYCLLWIDRFDLPWFVVVIQKLASAHWAVYHTLVWGAYLQDGVIERKRSQELEFLVFHFAMKLFLAE